MPRVPASAVAVVGAVAVASALGAIGADSRWLAALGREIVDRGAIPDGVPFASAPSGDWENVLVAAEVLFRWLDALGDRGLLAAQLVAVAVAFATLAADARRSGARDTGVALVLLLIAVGTVTSLAVVRVQLFSVALFPLTLALLHEESRRPSRRIWLLVPLLAVWGNLHGAVLVGFAVASAYLVLERARAEPATAAGLWLASALSLFANPALLGTFDYYRDVLTNEAADRGAGLWAPLSIRSPFDLLFVAAAAVVVLFALRARPRLWETIAMAGLLVLTVRTARSGVWLLFAAAVPAARALAVDRVARPRVATVAVAAFATVALVGLVRGPLETGASARVLDTALSAADGSPVVAEPALAEQVALAGGRIWLGNPLDAFPHADQRLYLDWLEGVPAGDRALTKGRVILVRPGSDAERRLRATGSFRELDRDDNAAVYVRGRS